MGLSGVMDENVSDMMVVSSESSAGGDVTINMDHIEQESCMLNKPNFTETKEVMCEKTKPQFSEDDIMQIHFSLTKMLRIVDSMDETREKSEQIGKSLETAMSPVAGFKMKKSLETAMPRESEEFEMKDFFFITRFILVIFLFVGFVLFLYVTFAKDV